MKHYILFSAPFIFASFYFTNWQVKTRTLTGVLSDEKSQIPTEDVSVFTKAGNAIRRTQTDGVFYNNVTERGSTLIFSREDYQRQEIKTTSAKEYVILIKGTCNSTPLLLTHINSPYSIRCCPSQL